MDVQLFLKHLIMLSFGLKSLRDEKEEGSVMNRRAGAAATQQLRRSMAARHPRLTASCALGTQLLHGGKPKHLLSLARISPSPL